MSSLKIELSHNHPDIWTLELTGSVDITNQHLLRITESEQSLLEKVSRTRAKTFVVDLSKVDYMDSQGFRYLHDLYRLLEPTGIQMTLKNPNPHLRRLLHIMRFDTTYVVEIEDDQEN